MKEQFLTDEDYAYPSAFGDVRSCSVYFPTGSYKSLDLIESAGWHKVNRKYHIYREKGAAAPLLLLTLSGKGNIRIQEKSFNVGVNRFCAIPPDVECEYAPQENELWEFYWIHFSGEHAKLAFEDILHRTGHCGNYSSADVIPIMERILKTDFATLNGELLASVLLNQLLSELMLGVCAKGEKNDIINRMLQYLSADYRTQFSMKDMAEYFHYSKEYTIRLFHKKTGTSPYQYWRQIRMEKAKRQLMLTNEPIEEIAVQAGYGTVGSFIKQFKVYVGVTPGQYRKDNSSKEEN